ncbi:MAG: prepilin-type N-terminal cleavage/methylation domain-containing protein [Halomonadaceae bacterium]|nr:MAG: prepilin-type N-terminal cleavage/methylation domain-containing protein [Halomonadaceae bacterium]
MPRGQQGITLIELVLTIVIVSVAVAGVVGAFALVTSRSADPLIQSRATALGQLYLDEILARNFDLETPLGGGRVDPGAVDCAMTSGGDSSARDSYRTVGQFNNLQESPPQLGTADQQALYQNFSVAVTVTCAGADLGLANELAKRIDIRVTDNRGQNTTLSAYKGNF